jgi:kynurenine formamidase
MVMNAQTAPPQNETSQWWPSKYGADDQAGALNEITPAKVLEAVRLVRQGRIYDLAHVLHQDIPAFPGRAFRQYLTTNYHQINRRHPDTGPEGLGHNSVNWIVEQVTATQQMRTHMDGLNHLQMGDRTYNGFLLDDIIEDYGTNRLGIDTLPQVLTRGLLVDVAASRGGERLQPGDVITVADAERAPAVTGHDVRPGDAVFFHWSWTRCTSGTGSGAGPPPFQLWEDLQDLLRRTKDDFDPTTEQARATWMAANMTQLTRAE